MHCTLQDNSEIADATLNTESEDTKTMREDIRGLPDDFIALVVEFGSTKRQLEESVVELGSTKRQLEESGRNYQVNAGSSICAQ